MTEIKISDGEIAKLAELLFERDHKDDPAASYYPWAKAPILTRQGYTRNARAALEALVASGWRREAEVLREAADKIDSRYPETIWLPESKSPDAIAANGVRVACKQLRHMASEAEQYVSAGTREGEDQKRDEEPEHG